MLNFFTKFFGYTKSEARGILFVLLLLVLYVAVIFTYRYSTDGLSANFTYTIDTLSASVPEPAYSTQVSETPTHHTNTTKKQEYSPKTISTFDINQADTNTLKKINGIGTVLSVRIIKFRDKLGGFVQLSQLDDVYGISEGALKELKRYAVIAANFSPQKIPLTENNFKKLASHPYIGYAKTKILVQYLKNGKTIEDKTTLKDVLKITDTEVDRISWYVF
jgi:competence protein ComEA